MTNIHTLGWDEPPPDYCRRGALSIGNFDGVHRGHLALLAELSKQARSSNGPAVALTFDPHPLQILRPQQFQPVLTTMTSRAELLRIHGADHVIILRTTLDLLNKTATEFFEQIVHRDLAAGMMVEGGNFGFGRNREGNTETLETLCRQSGIDLTIVPPVTLADGMPVSSSRVRSALVRGDVRAAAALLGRPFRIEGTVVTGQKRGQTIGFPTANLERIETILPRDGVYAVRAYIDGKDFSAAANLGPNPTFKEAIRKVEVHLLDFQGDLYDQVLAVDFVERLRDTRSFAGKSELAAQLQLDVDRARTLLALPMASDQ